MRPQLVVPVHDLDVSGRDFSAAVPASWLSEQLAEAGSELVPAGVDGRVAVHVSRSGNDVVVHGKLHVDLRIPCARCLSPVSLAPELPLSLLLVPATGARGAVAAGAAAPRAGKKRDAEAGPAKARRRRGEDAAEETELAAEDAELDTYEGEEVVLDRFVREAVLLEEPIFPLCSEDCEGIPPPPLDEPAVRSPFAGLTLPAKKTPPKE